MVEKQSRNSLPESLPGEGQVTSRMLLNVDKGQRIASRIPTIDAIYEHASRDENQWQYCQHSSSDCSKNIRAGSPEFADIRNDQQDTGDAGERGEETKQTSQPPVLSLHRQEGSSN